MSCSWLPGTGPGWTSIVDFVGLVTFGIGKGLVGGAEATAEISGAVSSSYRTAVRAGSLESVIEAGGTAAKTLENATEPRLVVTMVEEMKEVVSIRPVFGAAMKAWQDGKLGAALGEDAVGTLACGFKSAMGMGSPKVAKALSSTAEAGEGMQFFRGGRGCCRRGSRSTGSCSGLPRAPASGPT